MSQDLLTICDMCKAADRGIMMINVRVLTKDGGKNSVRSTEIGRSLRSNVGKPSVCSDSGSRMRYAGRQNLHDEVPNMATLKHPEKVSPDATTKSPSPNDPAEGRRRRIAALEGVFGIWAERKDIPADGLDYQRELRAEWC